MSKIRVADYVASFIYEKLKVNHVFTLTGAGIMHLTDGLACHPQLKTICMHHEQSCSMAMDAYSRASENFAVGYFTTGPGGTNAITGLAGAWQDSVACLFISGQVKQKEASFNANVKGLRQFGVQELNIIPIVESLTKYSIVLNDPLLIRYELEKAVSIAKSGRPGPVWIDIPMDVQASQIDPTSLIGYTDDLKAPQAKSDEVNNFIQLLSKAKRPVIIAGQGVRLSKANEHLEEFASKHKIPVVTPYLGIDNLRHDLDIYIGKTGIKGDRSANYAMQNADLILAIGTSLHVSVIGYDYAQFAREAVKVVVDIDLTSHKKKTIQIDHLIHSDANFFIKQISTQIPSNLSFSEWLLKCDHWKDQYKVCLPEYSQLKDAINIYSFVDQLSKQSEEGDIFISDAGSAFYATSQGIQLTKRNQRYIPSGAMATMGFSLPAAIGASAAVGNKRILAITGDGSLQQNIQELQTLKEYGLPVKLFVLNNNGYLSIRVSQKNYYQSRFIGEGPESGVTFPDTLKICDVYGIKSIRVNDIKNLEKIIEEVLAYPGPVVCDVICPKEQAIIPTISSKINPDGTMSSRPLEDMAPFLPREEYLSNMIVKEI